MLGDPFITRLLAVMAIAVALASLQRLLLVLAVAAALVGAWLALGTGSAHAFSCDQVRQYTAGKSAAELAALAKQYGVSDADIAKGKACLAGPKRATRTARSATRAARSAARHAVHHATRRVARARPHAAVLPRARPLPVIADERPVPPVVVDPPLEPAPEVEPAPALNEPKPDAKPEPEAPSLPEPKGHPMLQGIGNLIAGLSWSTLILIAIVGFYVVKNGGPSVRNWFKELRGHAGEAQAELKADVAKLTAEVDAVKLHLGIPVPVPPTPPVA